MTLKSVKQYALALRAHRKRVALTEMDLLRATQEYLEANRGGVREIARAMGFSPQYICDVRYGRRKISDTFVERLERLK